MKIVHHAKSSETDKSTAKNVAFFIKPPKSKYFTILSHFRGIVKIASKWV